MESMYPPGDEGYERAPRDGSRKIHRSLTSKCTSRRIVHRYEYMLRILPPTELKVVLVGNSLFVTKSANKYGL